MTHIVAQTDSTHRPHASTVTHACVAELKPPHPARILARLAAAFILLNGAKRRALYNILR